MGMMLCAASLLFAGCRSEPQVSPEGAAVKAETAGAASDARGVAEKSLGKQAEILAQGDLALNGLEQVLVVNRFSPGAADGVKSAAVFVVRAAVLQRDGGRWSEVLLCDEHLKNPYGYLGRSPAGRVNGWRLEFMQDAKVGMKMKFTPAENVNRTNGNTEQDSEQIYPTFDVRWNKNAKRYQAFDQSHERYLSEIPSLETPQSILR